MRNDYLEGARIMQWSARGAAALAGVILLRLQAECGAMTDSLTLNIDELLKLKRLSAANKKKMEFIIVVRDSAVHLNEMDVNRDIQKVKQVYRFIDELAADMLEAPDTTDPEVAKVLPHFMSLPANRRKFIADRDKGRKP